MTSMLTNGVTCGDLGGNWSSGMTNIPRFTDIYIIIG